MEVEPLLDPDMKMVNTKARVKAMPNIQIAGDDQQILNILLSPGESILSSPGTMCYSDPNIDKEIDFGCGDFFTRTCCAGEDGVRVNWQNQGETPATIGLTPNFPAKVLPINLDELGGELFVKSGAFMASMDPDIEFNIESAGKRSGGGTLSKGVMGGQGFFLVKLKAEGFVFLNAAGTILEKVLKPGQSIVVDQSSLVAWQGTVQFSIKRAGSIGMMFCGGEGIANTKLTGPGLIVLQSMPFEKVKAMMATPQ